MSRKMKRGVGPTTRGRHKRARSKETRKWMAMLRAGKLGKIL
jgi:hypothetical protein